MDILCQPGVCMQQAGRLCSSQQGHSEKPGACASGKVCFEVAKQYRAQALEAECPQQEGSSAAKGYVYAPQMPCSGRLGRVHLPGLPPSYRVELTPGHGMIGAGVEWGVGVVRRAVIGVWHTLHTVESVCQSKIASASQ